MVEMIKDRIEIVIGECFHCQGDKIKLTESITANIGSSETDKSNSAPQDQKKRIDWITISCKKCKTLFSE